MSSSKHNGSKALAQQSRCMPVGHLLYIPRPVDTSVAGLFESQVSTIICATHHRRKQIMQLDEEPEENPLDKIDRAIEQSSQELKRLSELYRMRGKSSQAHQIDETLSRMAKRSELETRKDQ